MSVKAIGKAIKKPIIKIFTNNVKNPVKYLRTEAIRNLKYAAPQAVRGSKRLFSAPGKENIWVKPAAQMIGKKLRLTAKRTSEQMQGKELSSLLNMASKGKSQLPFLAGGSLMRMTQFNLVPTNNNVPSKKKVFIIGATSSGKTHISIKTAKKLQTEVINTDALQVYKHANIMCATADATEQDGIKHHLLSFLDLDDFSWNVNKFVLETDKILNKFFLSKIPILVGGTHLYIEHLLYENIISKQKFSENDKIVNKETLQKYQNKAKEIYEKNDITEVTQFIKELDEGPDFLLSLFKNDHRRVLNGLKRFIDTGTLKQHRQLRYSPEDLLIIYPKFENQDNFKEIVASRVDKMIYKENGYAEILKVFDIFIVKNLIKECGKDTIDFQCNLGYEKSIEIPDNYQKDIEKFMNLLKMNLEKDNLLKGQLGKGVLQAIGYSEFYPFYKSVTLDALEESSGEDGFVMKFFNGRRDLDFYYEKFQDTFMECKESLTINTLKLAKRQEKWIRNRICSDENLIKSIYEIKFQTKDDFFTKVQPATEQIAENFMLSKEILKNISSSVNSQNSTVTIKNPKKTEKNNKTINFCKKCQEQIVGDLEWKVHNKSKKHKKDQRNHKEIYQQKMKEKLSQNIK